MDSSGYVSGRVWGPARTTLRDLATGDVWGPTGPVHALAEGESVAVCGTEEVRPTGGPWPPAGHDAREPVCIRCRRQVPRRRH